MKKAIFSTLFIAVAGCAMAQNTETAYFTDGFLYGHEMNPAKGARQGYVSIPALGNYSVDINGNIGIEDVLYNVNGRTVLFTNPNVTAEEFLKNINDDNKFNANMKMQILSVGFKGFGGYNTLSVGASVEAGVNVPGTLFRMAKEGLTNTTYDFSNLNIHAHAYTEVALGHSHQIGDDLRIGAKAKVLLGIANFDAQVNKATLTLGDDAYTAVTNAEVQASVKGFTYKTETEMRGPEGQQTPHTYVNGGDVDSPGLNGLGFAADLGAEYKVLDNLTVSAAVLDLGFINYKNNMLASTKGDRTFTTSKYTFSTDDNASNSFDNEMDRLTEDLASLYELQDCGDKGSRKVNLSPTINAGVEYSILSGKKLTVGALYTQKMGDYGWSNGRLSINAAPAKWVSASVSGSIGTYGPGLGWALNLHPTGFSLFMGMDYVFSNLAKQGVPLSTNGSFNIGVNIPF